MLCPFREILASKKIILASLSERRKELLDKLVITKKNYILISKLKAITSEIII